MQPLVDGAFYWVKAPQYGFDDWIVAMASGGRLCLPGSISMIAPDELRSANGEGAIGPRILPPDDD